MYDVKLKYIFSYRPVVAVNKNSQANDEDAGYSLFRNLKLQLVNSMVLKDFTYQSFLITY